MNRHAEPRWTAIVLILLFALASCSGSPGVDSASGEGEPAGETTDSPGLSNPQETVAAATDGDQPDDVQADDDTVDDDTADNDQADSDTADDDTADAAEPQPRGEDAVGGALERSGAQPDVAACYADVMGDAGDFETLDELNEALLHLAPTEQAQLALCAPQDETGSVSDSAQPAAAEQPSPEAEAITNVLTTSGISAPLAECYAVVLAANAGELASQAEIDIAVESLPASARQDMQRCASIYPA